MKRVKAGFSKVNITPPIGTPIGGNARDDYASKGIHDNLYAKTIFIDDGNSRWALVMTDLIAVVPEMVADIRAIVAGQIELKPEQIMIAAIHTHSGPDVWGLSDESKVGPEITAEINSKIAQSIIEAVNSAEETTVYYGRGENDQIGHNRRLRTKDGATHMNWEGTDPGLIDEVLGPVDPEISVLKFEDAGGKMKAVFVNYTCHPAILAGDNLLMGADYAGYLYKRIEEKYGDDVIVAFGNGAAGNINHIDNYNPDQGRGFAEADRLGTMLANDVVDIISSMKEPEEPSAAFSRETFDVPRRQIDDERVQWARGVLDAWDGKPLNLIDGLPDEFYATEALKLKELESQPYPTEVQVFKLSEDVAIVSYPGEIFVEFGLEVKEKSPFAHTIIVELANDCCGYVPTRRAFEEGGYEPTPARSSQLDPCAGGMIVEKALNQLNQLKQ
jgi:Neutral/alkaline non-lysosomal ceramidase, N-terminal